MVGKVVQISGTKSAKKYYLQKRWLLSVIFGITISIALTLIIVYFAVDRRKDDSDKEKSTFRPKEEFPPLLNPTDFQKEEIIHINKKKVIRHEKTSINTEHADEMITHLEEPSTFSPDKNQLANHTNETLPSGNDTDSDKNELPQQTFNASIISKIPRLLGVKWCGGGYAAKSYDDLGRFRATDACCREHDSCPDWINAGEEEHDLENTDFFAWSLCDCDAKLYQCFKKIDSYVSNIAGYTYFTVLAPKCFRKDYPIVGCKKYRWVESAYKKKDKHRCVEYELDRKSDKVWQLFDSEVY